MAQTITTPSSAAGTTINATSSNDTAIGGNLSSTDKSTSSARGSSY